MVQVEHDGDLGALNDRSLHQLNQIGVVGISPGAFGHLEDNGGLLLAAGLGDASPPFSLFYVCRHFVDTALKESLLFCGF